MIGSLLLTALSGTAVHKTLHADFSACVRRTDAICRRAHAASVNTGMTTALAVVTSMDDDVPFLKTAGIQASGAR
jgi:hypothetical protein